MALLYFRAVRQDGGATLCLLSLAGVSGTVAGRASNAMGVRPETSKSTVVGVSYGC